jgi:hypothetical protein
VSTGQIVCWVVLGLVALPLVLYQCAKMVTYGIRKANQMFDKSEKGES